MLYGMPARCSCGSFVVSWPKWRYRHRARIVQKRKGLQATMYVGLDLSLRATGVGVVNPDDAADCRVLTLSPKATLRDGARLLTIYQELAGIFDTGTFSLVAIEGYSFGSKNGQFQLGEVGGITRLLLTQRGIPYIIVPPNVLKKWTTGSGTADKIAMAVSTFDKWGMQFGDDNQCDAFNLAILAAAYADEPMAKLTAEHKKILEALRANPLSLPKGKSK